jgi:queuine/archaeosine tRNA-ribosyltransferase
VQGGLDADLREQSAKMHIARDVNGFAVGGLRYFFAEPITKNTVD